MPAKQRAKHRLLFFNWAQFDDPKGHGGGVTVYLNNLLDVLSLRDDLDIFFLSAGVRRSWLDRRVHWCETANVYADRGVRSFAIVNSPVRAPGRMMFRDMEIWQSDETTREALRGFLAGHGPFDAVHMHNLEGISSAALALAPEFPDTRFYFTWHNYIPVCPQVHLLRRDVEPCLDYAEGRNCVGCVEPILTAGRAMDRLFLRHFRREDKTVAAERYESWRQTNLHILNDLVDGTIAVSPLVKDTVVSLGAKPGQVHVVPLGMDVHQTPQEMKVAWAAKPAHEAFTFSFIGYPQAYKGLPFLADALERASDPYLKRHADLILAARVGWRDKPVLAQLRKTFRKVTVINGYERSMLPEIARLIDVNVVPSIWRETFNQVSYELACLGTPSLLSSTVGFGMFYEAKQDFVFDAGNHADVVAKMSLLARNPEKVAAFWDTPLRLPNMQEHAAALLRLLLGGSRPL